MDLTYDLFPTLVVLCGLLVLVGGALLVVPRLTPAPYRTIVRPLADLWLLGVVVLGLGGALGALLFLRNLY